ncbi:MAG: 3'-5' exonuclease [Acetobacter sp.]|uniref:3'-5' exonuclease n=1 Tax=Acetobacter sp. TaxID=440 RepID=UPI003F8F0208
MRYILGFFIISIAFNYFIAWKSNRHRIGWAIMGIVLPIASGMVVWALPKRETVVHNKHKDGSQDLIPNGDSHLEEPTQKHHDCAENNKLKNEETTNMAEMDQGGRQENNKENLKLEKIYDNEPSNNEQIKRGILSESRFYIKGSKKPLFLDVETTGLHGNDAIVSIGIFLLYAEESQETQKFRYLTFHCIFDPCKKSHPIAEKIHGYDDWTLRHQELFEQKADEILELIKESDLIVAHNVKFDVRFLSNAFSRAGIEIGKLNTACTMEMHGGSLAACADAVGITRSSGIHDAAEDAAMCMCLYLKSMSNINIQQLYPLLNIPTITNFILPPPRPDGPLPRRNNIKKRNKVLLGI